MLARGEKGVPGSCYPTAKALRWEGACADLGKAQCGCDTEPRVKGAHAYGGLRGVWPLELCKLLCVNILKEIQKGSRESS